MKKYLLLVVGIYLSQFVKSQGIGYGCPDVLDQQQTGVSNGAGSTDYWQSFTCGNNGVLGRVDVRTNGCLSYNYTLSIYAGTGVGGTLLYTGTYNNPGLCNAFLVSTIPSSLAPAVSNNNVYTFRIKTSITSALLVNNSGTYSGGVFEAIGYPVSLGWDMTFKTYVQQTSYPSANISAPTLTLCPTTSLSITGNNNSADHQWYNTSGAIPGATNKDYTATSTGTYAMVLTNTNTNCYSTSNTLIVTGNTVAPINRSYTICSGNSILLTSTTSATTYSWSTGASTSTVIVTPGSNSTFTVEVSDITGCETSTLHNVSVNASPALNINGTTATVSLGNLSTNVSDPSTVYFNFPDPLPVNARISGFTLDFNAVDQGWGGTGCYLSISVSGEATGGAILSHTSQPFNYFYPTSALTYTYGSTNKIGLTFCGWSGWQAFTTNTKLIIHYDVGVVSGCAGVPRALTASGASSYVWSGGISNGVSFTPTSTTVYTVTGTNANGCSAIRTATVQVIAGPTMTITGSSTVCAGNSLNQAVSGADSYNWSTGGTFTSYTFAPNPSITYSIQGTSTLTGCSSQVVRTISSSPIPTISIPNYTVCAGKSVTLVPNGASTYTFSSGTAIVTPTASTIYSVAGTSTAGCVSNTLGVSNVTRFTLPPVSLTSGTLCSGSVFFLNPSGASTYTLSSGASFVTPTITTNYTVVGTDANTCTNSAVAAVSVFSLPSIAAPSGSICVGNSFAVNVAGAASYVITGGLFNVSPTVTTSYSVTGTSTAGCTNTVPVVCTVSVIARPTLTVASGSVCSGQSFTLQPGGASTYNFLNGGPVVTPTITSTYSISGLNTAGCGSSVNAVATISVFATPIISVNSGTICQGSVFSMTPTGASTYVFSGPGTSNVSPTTNTVYFVSGTSTAGCTSTTSAASNVTVHARPSISVNSGTLCQGKTFTMTPSGAASYTFSNGSFTVSPLATTAYSVTGTSSLGCVGASTAVCIVSVFVTPTISVSSGTLCSGRVFTFQPSGASTYSFSSGSNTVSPLTTTSYSVAGSSTAGCVSASSAICTVSVETTPTITVADGTICVGKSFTLDPQGANSYSFQGGSDVVSPLTTRNYIIVGLSPNSCTSSPILANIVVNPLPTLTANITPSIICVGASVTPIALGAVSYTWTGGLVNNASANPQTSSSYSVGGTDANGCINRAVTTVTVNSLPVISVSSNKAVSCEAETVSLTASGAKTYTWLPQASGETAIYSPTTTSIYTLSGTDQNNCKNTVNFTQSVVICAGSFSAYTIIEDVECQGKANGKITVKASSNYSQQHLAYEWNSPKLCPANDCSVVENLDAGFYKVKVILTYTLNGFHVKRDSLLLGPLAIEDKNGTCDVSVFSGVSANFDGDNDHLHITNIEQFPKNKVVVFNRWGSQVFEMQGYNNSDRIWPTNEQLDQLPASTYFYVIYLGNNTKPIRGWIELIKN